MVASFGGQHPDPHSAVPNRLPPADRYLRDANFKQLVDVMYSLICAGEFTGTEIREAAILALTKYESYYVPSHRITSSTAGPRGGT